jgi:hypothetical protein
MAYRVDPLAFVSGAASLPRNRAIRPDLQDQYALVPVSMLGDEMQPIPQPLPTQLVPASSGSMALVKKVVAVIVVIAILAAIYEMWRRMSGAKDARPALTANKAARKLSTAALAKQLLERLEKKGSGNPTTLRSLKTYARKA